MRTDDLRNIFENKSRIILVRSTSGYEHSLSEVLNAPTLMNLIQDQKAAQEVRALKDFFTKLNNDPHHVCYGPKHVEVAHERMAVQTLLITDELFRSADIATRQRYVNLVNTVKDSRGTAHVFSSMDVLGESLYLDKNKLITLPPEVGDLKNLKVLTVDCNILVSVPDDHDRVPAGQPTANNCCSSNETVLKTQPSSETNEQRSHGLQLRVLPDFAQVYGFIGSVFDPYTSGHLRKLKKMDPIDVETALLLMRNLSINLTSPAFEDHRRLLSSYEVESEKETSDDVIDSSSRLST